MLKDITEFQRKLCEPCEYRLKEQESIVVCPLTRNCPKMKTKMDGDFKTKLKSKWG